MQTQGLTGRVSALPGSLAEHAGLQVWGLQGSLSVGTDCALSWVITADPGQRGSLHTVLFSTAARHWLGWLSLRK